MTKTTKYILIALGILIAAGLAWWLGDWFMGLLFGTGGLAALRQYAQPEIDAHNKKLAADRVKEQQLAQLLAEELKAKEAAEAQRQADEAATRQAINSIQTKAQLDQAVDREADALERFLEGEDGFIRPALIVGLLLLFFFPIALYYPAPAPARAPTTQEVNRAARVINLLKKAKRKLLEQKRLHALEIKKIRIQHQAELKKQRADLHACQQQKQILLRQTCPSCWPGALIAGLAVAGACGGIIGIREVTR